jgi:chaperonin cofactor prefoldin
LESSKNPIAPEHYASRLIPPDIYAWANDLSPIEFNVVKYVTRWRDKGGIQDLEKAKHSIELLILYETSGKELIKNMREKLTLNLQEDKEEYDGPYY